MSAATARILDTAREGRTMAGVLAITLFLTVLAAAGGIGAARAALALRAALSGEATVQIVSGDAGIRARRAEAVLTALRTSPAVRRAALVPRADLARLLGPWLGEAAADTDLPVPALIDVTLAPVPGALARLHAVVRRVAPDAQVDAHVAALGGTGTLLAAIVAVAAAIVLLMIGASIAIVLLAIRSGLAAHRGTIEIMHALGATDAQVGGLFRRRIARDAAAGAVIGGVAAWGVILLFGRLTQGVGSQLLGGVTLGEGGWIAIVALPFVFVIVAALVAYGAVLRVLGRLA